MAAEEDLAEFVQQSLYKLVEVGTTGALVRCFADYPEDLWDRPPCSEYRHERSFGLVRGDDSLKAPCPGFEDVCGHPSDHP
jgi:endo-1,4-beta-mannosidase